MAADGAAGASKAATAGAQFRGRFDEAERGHLEEALYTYMTSPVKIAYTDKANGKLEPKLLVQHSPLLV